MSEFKVGDRVSYNGTLNGKVEFVGTTHFSPGVWYGVSLDTAKGKNDGSVTGKTYFKCEKNHGIFVRNTQLTKLDNSANLQHADQSGSNKKSTPIKSESENVASEVKEIPNKETDPVVHEVSNVNSSRDTSDGNDLENLIFQIKDLTEKLQTLQIKRNEDKEKLREFEKMKINIQQLEENKKHLQERAVEYQRSYDKAKQDHAKLNEDFEHYREEMSSLADNIEMLTIDKEMAEEKLEVYRSEIEDLKGKNEELALENEILKLEQKGGVGENGADNTQILMVKTQNSKLRDAIVLMRDINENQKAEYEKFSKEASKFQLELEKVTKERDRLLLELKEAQENIIELKEQVDSALGADEMVSNLTEKNLSYEEKIRALEDFKMELEELCDMNNEINENNSSIISDMKQEISNKDFNIQELNTVLVAKNECILDYEETIEKFRELVKDLQLQLKEFKSLANKDLDLKGLSESGKASEVHKSKVSETKTIINIIESELQKLDVKQASNHVAMLQRFLPDRFFKAGGDNDSIMMLLLTDKLMCKIELLTKQIKDEFLSTPEGQDDEQVKENSESLIYYHKLIFLLNTWYIILRHYKRTLSCCQITTFTRFGALFSEMNPNEKSLDYFVELLKKGQLNENSSIEPLERSINYFKTFYQVHLVNEPHDFNVKIIDFIKVMLSGSESLEYCSTLVAKYLEKHNVEGSESSDFATQILTFSNQLKVNSKNIRKNMTSNTCLRIGNEVSISLDKCVSELTSLVKVLSSYCLEVTSKYDEDEVGGVDISLVHKYIEKFMELKNVSSVQPLLLLTENIIKVTSKFSDAMEHGEYDFDGTSNKIEEPIILIANNFKNDLSNLESNSFKLEQKDEELKQIKINFKMKCDELSEMSVRLNIAEKKLSTIVKEKDEIIERLELKLEQTKSALIRKERELDQTSEALQADIVNLESQREELRKQLKETKKRSFFDNISVSSSLKNVDQLDSTSIDHGGFTNEIQTLRTIMATLYYENFKLKAIQAKNDILKLQPLFVPKKEALTKEDKDHSKDIGLVLENVEKTAFDVYNHMSSVNVIDLSKNQVPNASLNEVTYRSNLKSQIDKFTKTKNSLITGNGLFTELWKDFKKQSEFVSGTECVGRISFGGNVDKTNDISVQTSNITITKIHNIFYY